MVRPDLARQTGAVNTNEGQRDEEVIRQALNAAVSSPFFPEPWFQTIFGVERDEVSEVLRSWPNPHPSSATALAINNALVCLGTNPYHRDGDWSDYTDASPEEAKAVLDRWRQRLPFESSGT